MIFKDIHESFLFFYLGAKCYLDLRLKRVIDCEWRGASWQSRAPFRRHLRKFKQDISITIDSDLLHWTNALNQLGPARCVY